MESDILDTVSAQALIGCAFAPGDLFPPDEEQAKKIYRRLAGLTHPDKHPEAESSFKKLSGLWAQYGSPAPAVIHGDIADLFRSGDGSTILKLARNPRDSDLMQREVTALRTLAGGSDASVSVFFPRLLSAGRQKDPATGITRWGSTLRYASGWVTARDIREAYPGGIDPRDAAWMFRRLLTALGYAHRAGIVHGAVLPEHLLLHTGLHGGMLIDWCYSCTKGQTIPAIVKRHYFFYPEEVMKKRPPADVTDLYMAGNMLLYLMSDEACSQLTAFARGSMLMKHVPPAHALLAQFDELLERLYGPPKFRIFTMPA